MDKIDGIIGNEEFDNPLLCIDFASFSSANRPYWTRQPAAMRYWGVVCLPVSPSK